MVPADGGVEADAGPILKMGCSAGSGVELKLKVCGEPVPKTGSTRGDGGGGGGGGGALGALNPKACGVPVPKTGSTERRDGGDGAGALPILKTGCPAEKTDGGGGEGRENSTLKSKTCGEPAPKTGSTGRGGGGGGDAAGALPVLKTGCSVGSGVTATAAAAGTVAAATTAGSAAGR